MSELNPGIRNTVAWLNDHEFPTVDSGDGKTHDFGCDRAFPYVVIQLDCDCGVESEALRLAELLAERGVKIQPISNVPGPQIQATYDPADASRFLELLHVDDALLFARPTGQGDGET